jgi:hypothetical protein
LPRTVELPGGRWTCCFDSTLGGPAELGGIIELAATQAILLTRAVG